MGTGKGKGKPNGNIMSFFKKAESAGTTVTDSKEDEEGLFLQDSPVKSGADVLLQTPTPPREESSIDTWPQDVEMGEADSPLFRYNEDIIPSKRRRMDDSPRQSPLTELAKPTPTRGPFVDDSDSDDEQFKPPSLSTHKALAQEEDCDTSARIVTPANERQPPEKDLVSIAVPILKREATSTGEVNDFEGIEDFIDDEFPEEGEEYLERRWMEEQAEFEELVEEEGQAADDHTIDEEPQDSKEAFGVMPQDAGSTTCPICGGNTVGLNDQVREIQTS